MAADRGPSPALRWTGAVVIGLAGSAGAAQALSRLVSGGDLQAAFAALPIAVAAIVATPFVTALLAAIALAGGTRRSTGRRARRTAEEPTRARPPRRPPDDPALHLLALLQQEGRFVDFIEENLAPYPDDQVGAAVRSIHEGCRAALRERLELAPILPGEEGAEVTVRARLRSRRGARHRQRPRRAAVPRRPAPSGVALDGDGEAAGARGEPRSLDPRARRGGDPLSRTTRYVVGIDLGTTNSVMACADTAAAEPSIDVVAVPQVVAPAEVEARELLPSFLYLADAAEVGTLDLPWAHGRDFAVGAFARDRGAEVPARLVASAKSWLCHTGVDRAAAILPGGRRRPAADLAGRGDRGLPRAPARRLERDASARRRRSRSRKSFSRCRRRSTPPRAS